MFGLHVAHGGFLSLPVSCQRLEVIDAPVAWLIYLFSFCTSAANISIKKHVSSKPTESINSSPVVGRDEVSESVHRNTDTEYEMTPDISSE